MFENFSNRARKIIYSAKKEAQHLDSDAIGTEHLLLAMLKEAECVGCSVLRHLKPLKPAARPERFPGEAQQKPSIMYKFGYITVGFLAALKVLFLISLSFFFFHAVNVC